MSIVRRVVQRPTFRCGLTLTVVILSTLWWDAVGATRVEYRWWLLSLTMALTIMPAGFRAVVSATLYRAAFPPYSWPTIWFCFTPLLISKCLTDERDEESRITQRGRIPCVLQFVTVFMSVFLAIAATIEFAVVTVDHHAIVSAAFLASIVSIPWAFLVIFVCELDRMENCRRFKSRRILGCLAFVFVGSTFELIASRYGLTYHLTGLAFAAGTGLTASLSALVPSLGLIVACLATNITMAIVIRELSSSSTKTCRKVACSTSSILAMILVLCVGLSTVVVSTRSTRVSISILLVQSGRDMIDSPDSNVVLHDLCDLTGHLLTAMKSVQAEPSIETTASNTRCYSNLVIAWPEAVLSTMLADPDGGVDWRIVDRKLSGRDQFSLAERISDWESAVLLGVMDVGSVVRTKYGLPVVRDELENTAIFLCPGKTVGSHELIAGRYIKRGLVPFRESVPEWVDVIGLTPFVEKVTSKNWSIHRGDEPPHFTVVGENGECPVGVSICYELFQPHLASFAARDPSSNQSPDFVIHLSHEEAFRDSREIYAWQRAAAIRRAMISGRWQLVVNAFSDSFIVSPHGAVQATLPGGPGGLLLQSDGSSMRLRALSNFD